MKKDIFLKTVFFSNLVREYLSIKTKACVGVSVLSNYLLICNLLYGMAGQDFSISLKRLLKKDLAVAVELLLAEVDQHLKENE